MVTGIGIHWDWSAWIVLTLPYPAPVPAATPPPTDFFQLKDLAWAVSGIIGGGVVGWVTSLWFYRRSRRDTVMNAALGAATKAAQARRLVQQVYEDLWRALDLFTQDIWGVAEVHIEDARRELEAGRADLVLTDQEALVDDADDLIDLVSEMSGYGVLRSREEQIEMVQEATSMLHTNYLAAGGKADLPVSTELLGKLPQV